MAALAGSFFYILSAGLHSLGRGLKSDRLNLSILKTNKARAIRFSTLEAICRELDCQPGDLLEFVPDNE